MPRLRRPYVVAALALALAGAAACSDVAAPNEDPAGTTYAPSLGVNIAAMTRSASGLYVQDVLVGTGRSVEATDTVTVRYSGWLTNGVKFDSTGTAVTRRFALGRGEVIAGWDEGLPGARIGGRRRLVVPPALGYGFRTFQTIPAGSVLVFDVDIVNAVPTPPPAAGGT